MTREEAIDILAESKRQNEVMRDNPSTFWVSHQMADGVKNAERRIAALNLALSALRPVRREQVERVWPGCDRCKAPDTAIAWERWGHQYCSQGSGTVGGCPTGRRKRMGWIRRETEKGTTQYICPNCLDYHEFRDDFGEQTFNENFIFCRRCGARNGTGTAPTLTPQNEWVSVEERLPELPEKDWCSKMVISCDKNGHVAPMIWERAQVRGKMIERWKYHWDRIYDGAGITHWMPLPAPPGEGNNVPNEPPNEPLTLEELREMDGVNALWVHNLAWGLHKPRFMLVHSVSEDWWTCCDFDGFETFCADDYGERYLLYRRPPEETA